jgi:hypothetical protein
VQQSLRENSDPPIHNYLQLQQQIRPSQKSPHESKAFSRDWKSCSPTLTSATVATLSTGCMFPVATYAYDRFSKSVSEYAHLCTCLEGFADLGSELIRGTAEQKRIPLHSSILRKRANTDAETHEKSSKTKLSSISNAEQPVTIYLELAKGNLTNARTLLRIGLKLQSQSCSSLLSLLSLLPHRGFLAWKPMSGLV